ncbi:MAG: hypothetical protein KBC95_00935 [Candidatus Peribacteraceae bacterium]|nr:hypothetical protein [Candidatus Peribacteraceae bacterium]
MPTDHLPTPAEGGESVVAHLGARLAAGATVTTIGSDILQSALFTDALAEEMALMEEDQISEGIWQSIREARSTAVALDRLQYCQTLGARMATKTGVRAGTMLRGLRGGLHAVINDPRTPALVRLAAEYAEACIALEEREPSGDVLLSGLPAERRIGETTGGNDFTENSDLSRRLALPKHWSPHDRVAVIASDAVGHLDTSNRLLAVASAQPSDLTISASVPPLALRRAADDIDLWPDDAMSFAASMEATLGRLGTDHTDDAVTAFGSRLGGQGQAWRAFWLAIGEYMAAIRQQVIERHRQAESARERLVSAQHDYEKRMKALMGHVHDGSDPPQIVAAAHDYLQALEHGDWRTTAEAVMQCEMYTRRGQYHSLLTDETEADSTGAAGAIAALEAEWRQARHRVEAELATDGPETEEARKGRQAVELAWDKLRSDPLFVPKLRSALLAQADEEEAKLFPAQWRTVQAVTHDPTLMPFKPGADEELSLLLRHVHRPAIRRALEGELGISLQTLPFVTQLHMARFLQTADQTTFDRLRRVLRLQPEDATSILKSFFACAEQVQMGTTILNIAEHPAAACVLRAYANLATGADAAAEKIATLLHDSGGPTPLTKEYFYRQLIVRANRLLRQFEVRLQAETAGREHIPEAATECAKRLVHENESVDQTRSLVECLPRCEVSHLNLSQLRTVQLQEIYPAASLKDETLKQRMTAVVAQQFPSGDDREFHEGFLQDEQARLIYSTCAGNLLAFFGMTPTDESGERVYLDWFFADPESPVQYLAEATLISTLKKYEGHYDYEHVAKPHVRSMSIVLEQMPGCVGFGKTRDGEYKHHYLRFRTLRAERDAYKSKALPEADLERLWALCCEPDTIQADEATGLRCCRIVYKGRDHHDDISAADDDGFIFRAMQELCENGEMVLTRAVPAEGNSRGHQEYLCVFERDPQKGDAQTALSA